MNITDGASMNFQRNLVYNIQAKNIDDKFQISAKTDVVQKIAVNQTWNQDIPLYNPFDHVRYIYKMERIYKS